MRIGQQVKKIWKHPDGRSRTTIGVVTAVRESGEIYVDQRRYQADGTRGFPEPNLNYDRSAWEWQQWHIDHVEPIAVPLRDPWWEIAV
jgi:hypothetical protein